MEKDASVLREHLIAMGKDQKKHETSRRKSPPTPAPAKKTTLTKAPPTNLETPAETVTVAAPEDSISGEEEELEMIEPGPIDIANPEYIAGP